MKNAPMPYSNVVVVPDVSASQPASGRPATPASPVITASARMARRSNPSRVPVRSIVMADMVFLSVWKSRRIWRPFRSRRRNLSRRRLRTSHVESRKSAHSEVLGIGEGEGGDGEGDRRDHAELGQRQPAGRKH